VHSAIRRRFKSAVMVLGVGGLLLGILGCQSGPKPDSSPGGKAPINGASSSPSSDTVTDVGATDVLSALRSLSPEFGSDPSVPEDVEFSLPDSLKNWVGIGLTCTRIVDAGKEVELSGGLLSKPYRITVEDQGKFLELKVPGPQPGILILSNGEVWGGLEQTLMARFYSPADSKRKGRLLDFAIVPRSNGRKASAPLRLQVRMVRVWQRTTRLEVLDRSLRFTSADGKSLIEFWRVGG